MNKKIFVVVIGIIVLFGVGYYVIRPNNRNVNENEDGKVDTGFFNIDFIRKVHTNKNYLISPYSVEIALNMVKDGASGNTKKQIENIVGNRKINNLEVKNKLGIANAAFIKTEYKNKIKTSYYDSLKSRYNSEIIYDEFNSPTVINNWVKEKTNNMIEKVIDNLTPNFVMGIANAIALDAKWNEAFKCDATYSQKFTKLDNSKINVEMMHNTFEDGSNVKYLNNDEVEGIILPYEKFDKDDVELEFVGLMPKKGIDDYIENLTSEKINNIKEDAISPNSRLDINLALPRFTYEYKLEEFIDILKSFGMIDAFDVALADFSNISSETKLYISDAVHKTKIELSEEGTKAAAVTYFSFDEKSMVLEEPKEIKNIVFDKPFIYMIRDSKTKEIVFFGSVYEPNIWEKTTCKEG